MSLSKQTVLLHYKNIEYGPPVTSDDNANPDCLMLCPAPPVHAPHSLMPYCAPVLEAINPKNDLYV